MGPCTANADTTVTLLLYNNNNNNHRFAAITQVNLQNFGEFCECKVLLLTCPSC